jgi:hypothetical protein
LAEGALFNDNDLGGTNDIGTPPDLGGFCEVTGAQNGQFLFDIGSCPAPK